MEAAVFWDYHITQWISASAAKEKNNMEKM